MAGSTGDQPDGVTVDEPSTAETAWHGRETDGNGAIGSPLPAIGSDLVPICSADKRYHGRERRGQPSRAAECEFDARLAIRELKAAHALYALADGIQDPHVRRHAMSEAHDRVGLARRFLEFVLQRPAK